LNFIHPEFGVERRGALAYIDMWALSAKKETTFESYSEPHSLLFVVIINTTTASS
jgi:hypothetical protein